MYCKNRYYLKPHAYCIKYCLIILFWPNRLYKITVDTISPIKPQFNNGKELWIVSVSSCLHKIYHVLRVNFAHFFLNWGERELTPGSVFWCFVFPRRKSNVVSFQIVFQFIFETREWPTHLPSCWELAKRWLLGNSDITHRWELTWPSKLYFMRIASILDILHFVSISLFWNMVARFYVGECMQAPHMKNIKLLDMFSV